MTEIEVLRYERDHAEARFQNAIRHLTAIHALLNPPITEVGDKRYKFINPLANEALQALSDAIRAIPEELRTPQTEAPHEEQVLYCPDCGSVGPVPKPYQHCCPDHGRARMVPKAFAEQCAATFRLAIQKPVVVNGIPSSEDPPSLR